MILCDTIRYNARVYHGSKGCLCDVMQNEVGFIGLGNMGAHMARNLVKKNFKVMVYDVNKDAVKAAVQDGKQSLRITLMQRLQAKIYLL